jgi:hypothetical protein
VKSVGLSGAKKGAAAKNAKPAKPSKVAPKAVAPLKAATPPKGKISIQPLKAKGKKEELKKAPKGAPAKPELKVKGKGKEVVVEVPAPKGVALLAKDVKGKKGKSSSTEPGAQRQKRCREPGCDHDFTMLGYCRLHYIKNWRRIKRKEAILASGQLNNYVEELVNKYPDKYLDVIRQDLASEKEWAKVVVDLELENAEEDGSGEDEIDSVAEGVRPVAGASRGEFDDEGDAF